ncbi:hypothetical protein [Mycobacterium sp.]|uniref:hypothetical protein n=1 Tax=Mycobacterium sp. TaxID=1785 RepID=UPI003D6B187E
MRFFTNIRDQLRATYSRLTTALGETVSEDDLDRLAVSFWAQEETHEYHLGCPDFRDRPALVFGVEGLNALCATDRRTALRLLEMAVAEIKATHPQPTDFAERFDSVAGDAR